MYFKPKQLSFFMKLSINRYQLKYFYKNLKIKKKLNNLLIFQTNCSDLWWLGKAFFSSQFFEMKDHSYTYRKIILDFSKLLPIYWHKI